MINRENIGLNILCAINMPALYKGVHVSGDGGGWVEKASDANLKMSLLVEDKTLGLRFIFLFLSSSLSSLFLLPSFHAIECIPPKPLCGI